MNSSFVSIGDHVDVIVSKMPDGTPGNYLVAGKVIRKHEQVEGYPCAYDLEFTVDIDHEAKKRHTMRIYNVATEFCEKRIDGLCMNSTGDQIRDLASALQRIASIDHHDEEDLNLRYSINRLQGIANEALISGRLEGFLKASKECL